MNRKTKKRILFIALVLFLLAWSFTLLIVGPQQLVSYIGIERGYLLVALMALSGGLSSFGAGPFYAIVSTLAAGGASIPLLAVIGGVGLAVGDSLFYLLGASGRDSLDRKREKWLSRVTRWLERVPRWALPLFIFAYVGLTPLPNDVLMISLGLFDVRYRVVVVPLIVGDVLIVAATAWLGFGLL